MASARSRQPWPMKWVVLFIVVSLAGYTYVNLKYRKDIKPFEPYEDMKREANARRLVEAGFSRRELPLERPAEPLPRAAVLAVSPAAAPAPVGRGLPSVLASTLVEPPQLPSGYGEIIAPAEIGAMFPVRVQFVCRLPDQHVALTTAEIFQRGDQIVVVPRLSRWAASCWRGVAKVWPCSPSRQGWPAPARTQSHSPAPRSRAAGD